MKGVDLEYKLEKYTNYYGADFEKFDKRLLMYKLEKYTNYLSSDFEKFNERLLICLIENRC